MALITSFLHIYDARIQDVRSCSRLLCVFSNVRTEMIIISDVHIPDSSSAPWHRLTAVWILIWTHVRRICVPLPGKRHVGYHEYRSLGKSKPCRLQIPRLNRTRPRVTVLTRWWAPLRRPPAIIQYSCIA